MPAAPPLMPFGLAMCAPVLLKFGTPAQQRRFLPRIYHGDDFWCQGYSEPGSGSDLASLATRAVRRGDHYVVNGQKTWTTLAHMADWIFCLVRTEPVARQEAGGHLVPADRPPDARHHRAPAGADGRRPRGERGLLRRRRGAGRAARARGGPRLDGREIPARPRADEHRAHRHVEARAGKPQGVRRAAAEGRPAAARRSALSRQALAPRDRADGARDHEPALSRPVARRPRARRGRVDAEDQGHRDPAAAHRADDAGGWAAGAADRARRR